MSKAGPQQHTGVAHEPPMIYSGHTLTPLPARLQAARKVAFFPPSWQWLRVQESPAPARQPILGDWMPPYFLCFLLLNNDILSPIIILEKMHSYATNNSIPRERALCLLENYEINSKSYDGHTY